jgi:hypothetical protein
VQLDKENRFSQYEAIKKKMTEEEEEEFLYNVEKIDKCWLYTMEIASVLLKNMSEQVSPNVL